MVDIWGVIVGGALAMSGSFLAKWQNERRQRKVLRAAIRAEIRTILRAAQARDFEVMFRDYVQQWDNANVEKRIVVWGFDSPQADPIFNANAEKIGTLGADVVEEVGMFYGLVQSIRVDLTAYQKDEMAPLAAQHRVEVVRRSLAMWDEAKAIADRLTPRL